MKFFVGISLALLACMAVNVVGQGDIQTFCGDQPPNTFTLKDVLLQSLVDAITKHFATTVIADDGFSPIKADQTYELFELFTLRYGGPASTESVFNSFLDGFYSNLAHAGAGDIATVIGLINIGEMDEARAEFFYIILESIEGMPTGAPLNYTAITPEQARAIRDMIALLYQSIDGAISKQNYQLFLSVRVGSTLSFAIDTTGSMSGEIADAKQRTISIINSTRGTLDQPIKYVLSPFNDPSYGPLTVTNSPEVIISGLNNLTARGGGDFPEKALKGIEQAILASSKRSIVFMVTDADALDPELENRVRALAIIKKIRVVSLLTSRLSNANGFPLYDRIAKASGGLVTVTSKSDFDTVTELFTTLTKQGRIILFNAVDRTEDSITFSVDPTLEEVTILLSGETGSFDYGHIENELGARVTNVIDVASANGLKILRVPVEHHTQFTVFLTTSVLYSVEVSALSIFGSVPTMFEYVDGALVHRSQPRAGTEAHVFGHLFGDLNDSELTKMSLMSLNGTEILSRDMGHCSLEEFRTSASFIVPTQAFFIRLQGLRNGTPFTRLDPCAVSPLVANIALRPIDDVVLDPGTTVVVNGYAYAEGSAVFSFDVSDPRSYVVTAVPSLINTTTTRVDITITVPITAKPGSLSPVLVTASPSTGSEFVFTSFNVRVRDAGIKCPASLLVANRGSRISCTDFNNVGSVCSVECEPDFVVDGILKSTCVNGTWTAEALGCISVERQTCLATGDPHYLSFDGKKFDFQGTCVYTLVKTTFDTAVGPLRPFSILVENQRWERSTTVSVLKRAFILIGDGMIEFAVKNQIIVDGINVKPPFLYSDGAVTWLVGVDKVGGSIVLTSSFGLTITFNGLYNLIVTLSGSYANAVTGLCGNMNGIRNDDFALAGNVSDLVTNVNLFGNSYRVGGNKRGCKDGSSTDGKGECLREDEYADLCGIVTGKCFEDCRDHLEAPAVATNCIFDMCVTKGNLRSIEQAVGEYATRCQNAGHKICDWRTDLGLVPACGANSHYEHEGTACPNTCRQPRQSARCTKPDVSGCVCNDGFVQSGFKCVPLTECGCSAGGFYYENGESFYTAGCTQRVTCSRTVLRYEAAGCETGEVCQVSPATKQLGCQPTSFGECAVSGDPHYRSFDGARFDFQGGCKYLVMEGAHPVTGATLKVVAQNEFRNGLTHVSWLGYVEVTFSYEGRDVDVLMSRIDGRLVATVSNAYVNRTIETSSRTIGKIRILTSGENLVLEVASWRVVFNGYSLTVRVPGVFARHVKGMCGNFNGDPSDDFRAPNGTLLATANEFGVSHQVGMCATPVPPPEFVCSDADRALYTPACSMFSATSSVFSSCASLVNFTEIFEECLFDVCAFEGDISVVKKILNRVMDKCRDGEVYLCDAIAMLNISEPACPENSHYETCADACVDTCSDPTASAICSLPPIDGCVCNVGYILDKGACVPEESCGCYPDGLGFVPQGFSISDRNCTHRCSCNGPNSWECENYRCVDDEECVASGDSYRCLKPSAECVIWGRSFVSTFDRRQYNFDGDCKYLALGVSGGEEYRWPSFGVIVDRESRGYMVTLATKTEPYVELQMHSRWKYVKVGGLKVLPGSHSRFLSVLSRGNFISVRLDFGVTLRLSPFGGLVISVSGDLLGKTGGLCGTFDNNPDNDFITDVYGTPTTSVAKFGNAWRWPNVTDDTCRSGSDDTCPNARFLEYLRGPHACGALDSDIFSACRSVVDKTVHKMACVSSLCNAGRCDGVDFLHAKETGILGFITECVVRGGSFPSGVRPWIGFDVGCPAYSHYEEEVMPCQPTCSDPDGSACKAVREFAAFASTDGCVCNDGYILSAGECVLKNKCGCVSKTDGLYYKHGDCQVDETCHYKCQCRNGEWDCEHDHCSASQYCGLREGEWGCHFTDECKYDNGGCSQNCSSVNGTTVCGCHSGYALGEDGKSCLKITTACASSLSAWKDDYMRWRSHYQNEYKRLFEAYKSGRFPKTGECSSPMSLPDEGSAPYTYEGSACNVSWTQWIDTDNATGCGDDESWERIRSVHPDIECKYPKAVEKRIVSRRSPVSCDIHLRLDSAEEGVLCDNTDQEDGCLCPDYEVRYLCLS